jgi:DNA-binding LacI/PurR family transcriptional regulator
MTDVARRAKVSQATVSYVINNVTTQSISEETRAAVERAIAELGYQRNAQARSLAAGTSGVVVCIVPPVPLAEPVLRLLGSLTAEFARRGLTMTVHFERSGDGTFRSMVSSLKPDVVFSLFPTDLPEGAVDLGAGSFHDPGSELQVDYVASHGHTRLAFAGSPEPELARQSGAREASVSRRAAALGLPNVLSAPIPLDADASAALVREWHRDGITAICANNDEVALLAIRSIRDAGLSCPADLSVIGYDASLVSALSAPRLTSIEWDADAAAPVIAELALGQTPTSAVEDFMRVRVVECESVAPL